MSTITVPVTFVAADQNGDPVAGARVSATLDMTEVYQGFVVPDKVEAVASAGGLVVLNLWPNALGVNGSRYRIQARDGAGKRFLDAMVSVPNSPCNLHEILVQEPYPPIDAAQQALMAAQGALALVTAQASIATASAADAVESEQAAAASAGASLLSAQGAAAERVLAQQASSAAGGFADTAITQAGIATTRAGQAAASAAQAEADAAQTGVDRVQTGSDRTATGADRAQTALDRTQTGADRVATAADRVQTGADAQTATTQAGIATTRATQALTSQNAAAGSAADAAADRVQTGLDRAATGADRAQTGLDAATATTKAGEASASAATASTKASEASASASSAAADRVQTGLDRVATGSDATASGLSAATATAQAGIATTKAAEAVASAGAATSSATSAAGSATSATASAATATTQASTATSQASNAAASAVSAAASFDAFDDRFLGAKAANPTLDNDGQALLVGAMYWNTAESAMRVWSGAAWIDTNELDGRILADQQLLGAVVYATDMALKGLDGITENRGTVGSTDRAELFAYMFGELLDKIGVIGRAISGGTIELQGGTAAIPSLTSATDVATGVFFPANGVVALAAAGLERLRITADGRMGLGTNAPSGLLDVADNKLRVRTAQTPASATAAGNQGEWAWDANFVYVCINTNTWRRAALTTW